MSNLIPESELPSEGDVRVVLAMEGSPPRSGEWVVDTTKGDLTPVPIEEVDPHLRDALRSGEPLAPKPA